VPLLLAGTLWAQPGSIATVPLPVTAPLIFDAAGNLYSIGYGPVTPGAAQTQSGGGTCWIGEGIPTSTRLAPRLTDTFPCPDAYVGKVDPSGNLLWGTYLGGPTADYATALAVDSAGNVFIAGTTGGSFPTTPNAAISVSATATAFAAKISADGSRVLYSTYLPDTATEPWAIAIDPQGNAYVAGISSTGHTFVVKLNAAGSAFLYDVSLAGSNQDYPAAILADAAGNVIVAGQTTSPDFPVSSAALQSALKGTQNVFLAKLDSNGRAVFSTYLGGSGTDTPAALQTDFAGRIYVAGQTTSLDFPTTAGTFQPAPLVPLWNNSSPGGFLAAVGADGSALAWSTYVPRLDANTNMLPSEAAIRIRLGATQLAVAPSGEAYISGIAGAGFPVTASAPQICFDGTGSGSDVFVAHLDNRGALLDATYAGQGAMFTYALSLPGDGSVLLASDNTRSQLRFGAAGWSAPVCLSPTILNAATMSQGPALAPGELVTLTGFGIGPDAGVQYQPDAQGQIPRQLAGVQVLFDGQPAPVLYAQSRQINAQAPVELSGQTQTNITLVYNQATLGPIAAPVMPLLYGDPGIFRLQPNVSTQAVAENQDGTLNGPSNPAPRGSIVAVWGTGFAPIDPPCSTGGLNPPGPVNLAGGLSVAMVDGTPPGGPAAPSLYAGSAPTLPCGVVQINFAVPTYLQPGVYQFSPMAVTWLNGVEYSSGQGTIGATIFVK
jgi:uncharacterized protein (TIGR03437 family)